jgi:deoxyribodipyrimidine photo-lyase
VKTVIHWFRRDLRVSDNIALNEATRRAEHVLPVFIIEDTLRTGPDVGGARLAFFLQSLEALRKTLGELGYQLIVRRGTSPEMLPRLCAELGAEAVFANKRYEPHAEARDQQVFNALNAAGVGFELFKDAVVWEEQEILTQAGKPFTVYTPYSKAWKQRSVPQPRPRLGKVRSPNFEVRSDPLPTDSGELGHLMRQATTPAGERVALERLRRFMRGPVYEYGTNRNFPAVDGTSLLSPHLCCGTIGIRTILAALEKAREAATTPAQRQSCEVFLNELIWREFYLQILHNFPHVTRGPFRPEYDKLAWLDNDEHFQAWCDGQTGYPIVDAAMRCLNATGYMHNRLRMIVAMFLTKDLLLNWQWGERYFMNQLVDGDLAANNGGWQWSAGTGTDAAPYFRIFNPVSQGEKFDPRGEFVRRWVTELASWPAAVIHQPWKAPVELQQSKYAQRIVLHEEQRAKCLALYQAVRPRPLSAKPVA